MFNDFNNLTVPEDLYESNTSKVMVLSSTTVWAFAVTQ